MRGRQYARRRYECRAAEVGVCTTAMHTTPLRHDFHATILHLLGMDHEKLVYNHHGLDEKLTGQKPARVVKEIVV